MIDPDASVAEGEVKGACKRGSKMPDVMARCRKLAESKRESVNAPALLCEGGICCEGSRSVRMRGITDW